MRPYSYLAALVILAAGDVAAQRADTSSMSRTFITKRDLATIGLGLGSAALFSIFDDDIALASQRGRFQDSSTRKLARNISKVHETTLTLAGIATYGIARLSGARMVQDVALHATESIVLASVASQLIRGPLGRSRPYVTKDSNQYDFDPFQGFTRDSNAFAYRAFPSIHTSSSMAVATVLVMETHRRRPGLTKFVAPVVLGLGIMPGLARIQLDQHWASDIAAGAFMGAFTAYKVVSYSHAHPNNRFDRMFLSASISPDPGGGIRVAFSPTF